MLLLYSQYFEFTLSSVNVSSHFRPTASVAEIQPYYVTHSRGRESRDFKLQSARQTGCRSLKWLILQGKDQSVYGE